MTAAPRVAPRTFRLAPLLGSLPLATFLAAARAQDPEASRPWKEPPGARERIAEIAAFGERLGLPPTANFRTFEPSIGGIHILYATPRFALGRHYNDIYVTHGHDRGAIERAAEIFRRRGREVRIETVEAVAEGGCPVTRALLEDSPSRQAYVVLHENAHVALRSDLRIEEPVADVIASIASEAYFREAYGETSDPLRACREDRARNDRLFAFVEEVYEKLASLYATLPEDAEVRERLRREALEEARRSFARQFDARACGFAAEELNDALLTRLHTFAHHRPLAFAAAASFGQTDEAVATLIRLPTSEEHAARILRALAARGPALPSTPSAR